MSLFIKLLLIFISTSDKVNNQTNSACQLLKATQDEWGVDSIYNYFDDELSQFKKSEYDLDIIVYQHPEEFGQKYFIRIYGDESSLRMKKIYKGNTIDLEISEKDLLSINSQIDLLNQGYYIQVCDQKSEIHSSSLVTRVEVRKNGKTLFYYHGIGESYNQLNATDRKLISKSIELIDNIRKIGQISN